MQSRYDRDDDDDRFQNPRGDSRDPRYNDEQHRRQGSGPNTGHERYRAGEYRDWRDDFVAPRFGHDSRRRDGRAPAFSAHDERAPSRGYGGSEHEGEWRPDGGYAGSSYRYMGRTWPQGQSLRGQYDSSGSGANWPRGAYGSPTGDSWSQGPDGHWQARTRDSRSRDWGSSPYGTSSYGTSSFGTSSFGDREASNFGKGPKGYMRSDERIREDICDRLSDDDEVDASEITVSVKGGEVTLEGSVTDRYSKRRAEDIVESVSGVQDVSNRLRTRKSFMQELGNKLTGSEDNEHRGHAGSGTRNGPGTSSASRSS